MDTKKVESKYQIIAVAGNIGTGKTTAARFLSDTYGFTELSFAGPLKDTVAAALGYPRDKLEGATPEDRAWREDPANARYGRTPRQHLQYVGTELFREQIDQNIWVDRMRVEIESRGGKIVISDVRFPNEVRLMQELGATIVHLSATNITRPTHASEQDPAAQMDVVHIHNLMTDEFFVKLVQLVKV